MRRARALLLTVLTSLGLLVGWGPLATPAAACTCGRYTESENLERAEAIFIGTLLRNVPATIPVGPKSFRPGPTTFVFEVTDVFKGPVQPVQVVLSSGSGAACGLGLFGAGPYLVLARTFSNDDFTPRPAPGQLVTSSCSGTRLLAAGGRPAGFAGPAPSPASDSEQDDEAGSGPVIFLSVVTGTAVVGFGLMVRRSRRRAGYSTTGR